MRIFDCTQRPPGCGFPIADFRRLRFRGGIRCPRCGDRRVQGWGRFGWRRRYRCRGCLRTFSDFTGTSLAYLKRVEEWPPYTRALPAALSLRAAAGWLGIHKDTAFRWRRRLLAGLQESEVLCVGGCVAVGETWFARSFKGARRLPRPARRRRFEGFSRETDVEWVVLASDVRGASIARTAGPAPPGPECVRGVLGGRVDPGSLVVSRAGRYGAAASFAAAEGLPWARESRGDLAPAARPEPAGVLAWRIKRWLGRFRGVATRYLDEYLVWFRLVELKAGRPRRNRSFDRLLLGTFP